MSMPLTAAAGRPFQTGVLAFQFEMTALSPAGAG
jgi:hypothetical protein